MKGSSQDTTIRYKQRYPIGLKLDVDALAKQLVIAMSQSEKKCQDRNVIIQQDSKDKKQEEVQQQQQLNTTKTSKNKCTKQGVSPKVVVQAEPQQAKKVQNPKQFTFIQETATKKKQRKNGKKGKKVFWDVLPDGTPIHMYMFDY
jgi:Tfp pilus assembly protein PilE